MNRKFLVIALVVAAVAVGAVTLLVSNLDSLVAKLIESEGSQVTGTDVAVSGVKISLKEGSGAISGLTIASPDGFEPAHAFTLGGIRLDLDLGSLRGDPVVIDEIRVSAPQVAAQILADGSSNILALQEHVEQYAAAHGGSGKSGDGKGTPQDTRRIRITRLVFDGGRIALDATALGDKQREVALPAFTLTDLGGSAGAAPDELAKAVLGTLTREAAQAIAKSGIKQKAGEVIEDQAKGLLDKIGG